jgi:hypothetical protein
MSADTWRHDAAETMSALAKCLDKMAQAIIDNDEIMGALAATGFLHLAPTLPAHIRHTLIEFLDDETARAHKAAILYWSRELA